MSNVVEFAARPHRPARRRKPATPPAGVPLADLIPSWRLQLRAANKSPVTIDLYTRKAEQFAAWLQAEGRPIDAEGVTPDDVRAFLVAEQERAGAPTALSAHAYLGVFFNWLISEEERSSFSPVLRQDKPHVPKKVRTYLTLEQLARLLDVCKGPSLLARRDTAIIRTLFDNGMRVSGLTGLHLDDVDLSGGQLRIRLKGRDEHWAPIGAKTAQAIDRYLRVRARHVCAGTPWLWLGTKNLARPGLTVDGVQKMLGRRGEQAGVDGVHPHLFRGTSAHELLAAGAHPDEVKRILGWKTDAMLQHYTEALADERARATHARLSPSDRL